MDRFPAGAALPWMAKAKSHLTTVGACAARRSVALLCSFHSFWLDGLRALCRCVLSGHADWATALALDTSGRLTLEGDANVCGSIGPCPLCSSGCKDVTVIGVVSPKGIDYSVKY